MAEPIADLDGDESARLERAWHEHETRQLLRGLELTPQERLRWLEDNLAEMRGWLGRARAASAQGRGTRSD